MIKVGEAIVYNVQEASQLLNVTPGTIRSMIKRGDLVGKKTTKGWYISEKSLTDYALNMEKAKADPEDRLSAEIQEKENMIEKLDDPNFKLTFGETGALMKLTDDQVDLVTKAFYLGFIKGEKFAEAR